MKKFKLITLILSLTAIFSSSVFANPKNLLPKEVGELPAPNPAENNFIDIQNDNDFNDDSYNDSDYNSDYNSDDDFDNNNNNLNNNNLNNNNLNNNNLNNNNLNNNNLNNNNLNNNNLNNNNLNNNNLNNNNLNNNNLNNNNLNNDSDDDFDNDYTTKLNKYIIENGDHGNTLLEDELNIIPENELINGPIGPKTLKEILKLTANDFVNGEQNTIYKFIKYIIEFKYNNNRDDSILKNILLSEKYINESYQNPIFQIISPGIFALNVDIFIDKEQNICYRFIQYIKYLIYNQMLNNQNNNQDNNQNNN